MLNSSLDGHVRLGKLAELVIAGGHNLGRDRSRVVRTHQSSLNGPAPSTRQPISSLRSAVSLPRGHQPRICIAAGIDSVINLIVGGWSAVSGAGSPSKRCDDASS